MRSKEPDLPLELELLIKGRNQHDILSELESVIADIKAGYLVSGAGGIHSFSRWTVNNTSPYYSHTYHDGTVERDRDCERENCDGIARVQMAWAPDTGMHWLKCEVCAHEWNPGVVRTG